MYTVYIFELNELNYLYTVKNAINTGNIVSNVRLFSKTVRDELYLY